MRRYFFLLFLPFLFPASALGQAAATPSPNLINCRGVPDQSNEARIAACDALVATSNGDDLAQAYYERCDARYGNYLRGSLNKSEVPAGYLDLALADCSKAIELKPGNDRFWRTRAEVYDQLGLPDRALADFGRAIALNPNYAGYYAFRGDIYSKMGNYDDAIADYEKTVALSGRADNQANPGNNFILSLANLGLEKARAAKAALATGRKKAICGPGVMARLCPRKVLRRKCGFPAAPN